MSREVLWLDPMEHDWQLWDPNGRTERLQDLFITFSRSIGGVKHGETLV